MFATTPKETKPMTTEKINHDLREGARKVRESVSETTNRVKHDLNDMAHDAGEQARALFDNANDQLLDATDYVRTQVREKPLQSTLVALGAGILIGLLYRR